MNLIIMLVLAFVAFHFAFKNYSLRAINQMLEKENKSKSETITGLSKMEKQLQEQVSLLVAELNAAGVKRDKKTGRFVSAD